MIRSFSTSTFIQSFFTTLATLSDVEELLTTTIVPQTFSISPESTKLDELTSSTTLETESETSADNNSPSTSTETDISDSITATLSNITVTMDTAGTNSQTSAVTNSLNTINNSEKTDSISITPSTQESPASSVVSSSHGESIGDLESPASEGGSGSGVSGSPGSSGSENGDNSDSSNGKNKNTNIQTDVHIDASKKHNFNFNMPPTSMIRKRSVDRKGFYISCDRH